MRHSSQDTSGSITISLMLAVPDVGRAAVWYKKALSAEELWNLGSVIGLTISEAPFFLHEPTEQGFHAPPSPGVTTVRVEATESIDTTVQQMVPIANQRSYVRTD